MKRYASALICVLFVLLASVLRHFILPHAKSAAVYYGDAQSISISSSPEKADVFMKLDI